MNVIVDVKNSRDGLLLCSQVTLQHCLHQQQSEKNSGIDTVYCIVFGLPTEATLQDLNAIFEPLSSEIEDIVYLNEESCRKFTVSLPQMMIKSSGNETLSNQDAYTFTQRKVFAIVKFCNEVKRGLFNALYHNMPFNAFRDCAPCMVANISQLEFITENSTLVEELQQRFPFCEINSNSKGFSNRFSIIPSCSLCIRRLKSIKQLLSLGSTLGDQEIAVGRSFHTESMIGISDNVNIHVRCMVCFIYHYYQTKSSSSHSGRMSTQAGSKACDVDHAILGSCLDCGLFENIWACLVCGYTGCGRYTQKHAEAHSLTSHHTYSLELATGRIWEYSADEFVHFEDSSSLYNGFLQQCTSLQFDSHREGVSDTLSGSRGSEPTVQKLLVSDRFLADRDQQILRCIGDEKVDKLNSLTAEYERMIELQLRDQQLYYDKLLARETVRAMEYSFNLQRGKLQDLHNDHRKPSALADQSLPVIKEEQLTNDGLVDQELEAIEQLKMDISSIEIEYKMLFDQLKEVEEKCRLQKKQNDSLLKEQKQLKLKEAEYLSKEEELRKKYSEQIQDLEQQIVDLSFFIKTKKQMDFSPFKDEIAKGVIITTEDPTRKKSSKSKKKF